ARLGGRRRPTERASRISLRADPTLMRVLHILRKYDPAEWGGTETAIRQLTAGLAHAGVESVVYAPRLARASAREPAGDCEVRRFRAYLPVWGLGRERRRNLVAVGGNLISFELIRSLWREKRASIIHAHTLGRLGATGLAIARRRGLPFVLTVHGGLYDLPDALRRDFTESGAEGWDWGQAFGLLVRSRNLVGEADAVITCNPREAELIRERHPGLRVLVQPHGVPLARFAGDARPAARAAFPEIAGRRLLLMPGRIDPVKNQMWVLEQAAALRSRHPDVLILMVGACTDRGYERRLKERLAALGLSGHVLMAGRLPPADLRLVGLLQEARAVLLPSVSETFGLVILEAWAAGTPTIASRTSGAVSLIDTKRDGWLFSLDKPEEFHRAIDEALAGPDARDRRGEAGRARVASEFDAQVLALRIRGMYEELEALRTCAT
ncbi:MAG: glycosyltransferase family 4 protein, partial [Opitutaceae bacterium]